jgi:hypothetical protein
LNFDWGSQSIAQSKFQRASRLGKENQQRIFEKLRQHLFRILFGFFCRRFQKNSCPFSGFIRRFAASSSGEGTRNMQWAQYGSSVFFNFSSARYSLLVRKRLRLSESLLLRVLVSKIGCIAVDDQGLPRAKVVIPNTNTPRAPSVGDSA